MTSVVTTSNSIISVEVNQQTAVTSIDDVVVGLSTTTVESETDLSNLTYTPTTAGAQGPEGPQGPQGIQGTQGDQGEQGEQGIQGEQGPHGPVGADSTVQGPQGTQGPQGPQGEQGLQGPTGDTGSTGPTGAKGDTGNTGPRGPQGDAGSTGPEGPRGLTGSAGPQGLAGPAGPSGNDGDQGPQGNTGPQGVEGDTGPQGVQGDTGPQGPVGADSTVQGPQGVEGDTGPQGVQGDTGPQGVKGDTGDTGPQGVKGDTGDTGPQGPAGADSTVQGPQGVKGDTGDTGPQGPAGADSTVQGPQGVKGDTGDTGPQGVKGDTGDTGPQGVKGDTGDTGPQGVKGDTGDTGPQGVKGDTGDTGPQGVKGDTGDTGPQGVKGDTGDTGPQGIQGIQGEQGDSGDIDSVVVAEIALGAVLGLEQSLLAGGGKTALTVLAVAYTNTGKVQGCSLGAGNVVEVYASGVDFNDGTVLYREFMNFGEPICFTGLSNGAIITSTQGFYGFSEQLDGSNESPMPLLSYGLSFKSTFLYAFRNSQSYPTGNSQGWIHVVNGPIASSVTLTNGSGSVIEGQQNIKLDPWQYQRFYTNANQEYILSSTNNVMAAINAEMGSLRFYDSRLIMPLTNDGITWPRSGNVSAPYDNTVVNYYVRDNAKGSFTVSPGSPVDFDGTTGANDTDYEPNGATRVRATGLISAYSGADSAGLEASPLMPTSAMTQVVAQPLFIDDSGDGGNSGVAIASPFEGTAKVYEYNTTTDELDLAYTVPLNRSGVTVTTQEDQYHPAAGMVANESANGAVALVGTLNAGVVVADVPITVVLQNALPTLVPSIRSQNGTTTTSIVNDDDETLSLGITPESISAEIREDADGIFRKRVISNTGTESWSVC